jgi:hypothetical protein
VDDGLDLVSAQQRLHLVLPRHVHAHELEWLALLGRYRLQPQDGVDGAARQVVNRRHVVVAAVDEHQRKMRADEAGAAGEEHVARRPVERAAHERRVRQRGHGTACRLDGGSTEQRLPHEAADRDRRREAHHCAKQQVGPPSLHAR